MKAVVWHGIEDVRVDEVPDPTIQEPTDASSGSPRPRSAGPTCTSTRCSGMYMDEGDILGHEPMGIVEEVGAEVTRIKPGDRVVMPFNISCGRCFMCDQELYSQCETTQVTEYEKGASLLGFSKLYGQVPGGQAEFLRVPQAQFGPIKVPEGPADERFLYLSDVLPTAWQAVAYADTPKGGTLAVYGLGPIGQFCVRIAKQLGVERVIGVDLVPERNELARRHGAEIVEWTDDGSSVGEIREATAGRGADAVIDAVGMEAHGAPVAETARQDRRRAARRGRAADYREDGHRPHIVAPCLDRLRAARRDAVDHRRLRRRRNPDADGGPVRQADPDPPGAGKRQALDRRHHAATLRRERPARHRGLRHAPAPARARPPPRTSCSRRSRTAPSRSC